MDPCFYRARLLKTTPTHFCKQKICLDILVKKEREEKKIFQETNLQAMVQGWNDKQRYSCFLYFFLFILRFTAG